MTQQEFRGYIYQLIRQIPPGRVATYGQLAFLAGRPNGARAAGQALFHAPADPELPCHRVVSAAGRTVPGWEEQEMLLRREGVPFRTAGRVEMKEAMWQPLLPHGKEKDEAEKSRKK
ncbi:MAG: methylated-DNA--[protein]-cysteine S-methyltransferase [Clostridiales bacterium]|nr:methylated-DNA--[protein]-cysteine S-methyltransferase [Clostridiales bacterium]